MWPFLKVLNCITTEHDLRLVGLAVVICALASMTAINLLHHVRGTNGHMRLVWLAVSATTTGFAPGGCMINEGKQIHPWLSSR